MPDAPAIALRYLELRFLERFSPGWHRPLRLLGYTICYTDLSTLRWLFKEIFVDRDYEPPADFPVARVVDAGANVGLATMFFRRRYPDAEIVCFEPDPRAFACLQRNLERNKVTGVTAHNLGLGTAHGEAILFVDPNVQNSCQSMSRSFATSLLPDNQQPDELKIRVAPLSEFLDEPVDVMKLDVEGSELNVLRGAGQALTRVRSITMEYHRVPEAPLHELLEVLSAAGHQYDIATPVRSTLGSVATIRTHRHGDLD